MRKIYITLLMFLSITSQIIAQKYDFVPDNLRLLSMEELFQKGLPTEVGKVYFEDGTKTSLQAVMPRIMKRELKPCMFVDAEGNYKVLVVVEMKNKSNAVSINYKNIPDNLKKLGYSFGNPNSNTVIIHTQMGPFTNLLTEELKTVFTGLGAMDESKYFVINIHQAQTLNPEKYTTNEISFEEAKTADQETTSMMKELVKYFKSENKTVYVVGLSFGAFVGLDLISQYGNIADGYLLMVGRLDMTEAIWQSFSKGIGVDFEEDATTVTQGIKPEQIDAINRNKIAAGYAYKRYTQLLKDIKLNNLIYYYGKKDQTVGKLTDIEVEFLKSAGAKVIGWDGGHNEALNYLQEGLKTLLTE